MKAKSVKALLVFVPVVLLGLSLVLTACPSSTNDDSPPEDLAKRPLREELTALIEKAESYSSNDYFTVQVSEKGDGTDVPAGSLWVTKENMDIFDAAIVTGKAALDSLGARAVESKEQASAAIAVLKDAITSFNNAKRTDGSNPYIGANPGNPPERYAISTFSFDTDTDGWVLSSTFNDDGTMATSGFSDGRWDPVGSDISWEADPFGDGNGKLKLSLNWDGVKTFGKSYEGIAMKVPLSAPVTLDDTTWVSLDLYYPQASNEKLMRFELWSTTTGGNSATGSGSRRTQEYVRPEGTGLPYLNGPVGGEYENTAYRYKTIVMKTPVNTGTWDDIRLDLHGDTNVTWPDGVLFIDNVKILKQRVGEPIPPVVVTEAGTDVTPIKDAYDFMLMCNLAYGLALHHYESLSIGNELKADATHPRPAQFLVDYLQETHDAEFSSIIAPNEWNLDSLNVRFASYIRDMDLKFHGHVLAWYNQGAPWMKQMVPQTVTASSWQANGLYYSTGAGDLGIHYQIDKETARHAYYDHIVHEMRHFMTTDSRFTDNRLVEGDPNYVDGILPFHSFDVLNEEIQETRHATIIAQNPTAWKTALRNTAWFMAMTDDQIGDVTQHFVYLMFKYAHIAVPNALMAAKYKENYATLPDWMKGAAYDNGSTEGIDAFVMENPPILYFNEYDTASHTKAQVAYNMVKEINTAWKNDPLYDGRPLIESMGFQCHDTVGPTLASDNQYAFELFATLIDQGLLSWIGVSEFDLVIPDTAPGGGASSSVAGTVLNQKQADVLGYEYALMFKVFEKYNRYIDHITIYGVQGGGWSGSFLPFDTFGMALPGYYGIMGPDKYIVGHSYLDDYFAGDYDKVK
jgi:GH35 family endo-1,4-beta-xylanase